MKFTVERDALHDGLSSVASRTKDVLKIPILTHVLMTASKDGLTLMSHDTASCCIVTMPADVGGVGECAVPADRFTRLVAGLGKGGTVTVEADEQQATVRCGRAVYKFPALPAADFPGALMPSDPVTLELSVEDVRRAFKVPAVATSDSDPRPYTNGVCLQEIEGTLYAVATDGHRLIRVSTNTKVKKFASIIIPRTALNEILSVAGKGGLTIEVSSNLAAVQSGGRRFVTRLIDAQFPGYERTIPPKSSQPFTVDAQNLGAALSRLMTASEVRPVVKLEWEDSGNIHASLRSQLGEGSEEIECDHGGKAAGCVGMQLGYLRDLVDAAGGNVVEVSVGGPGEPVRFDNPNDPSFLAICLPIGILR